MTRDQAGRRTRTRWCGPVALAAAVLLSACGTGSSAGPRTDPSGPSSGPPQLSAVRPSTTSAAGAREPEAGAEPARPSSSPRSRSQTTGEPSTRSEPWVGTFHGHRVTVPRGHGAHVSFTFDDGPSPRFTPQVLALLDEHDVAAVFCVIGQEARAHPGLVRREVEAGHVLCNHSRDHDLAMNRRGQAYVNREVTDGLAAIEAVSPGTPVPFYRQPGGTWSPLVVRAMDRTGLIPLRWTDDPRDWSNPGSAAIVRRVTAQLGPDAVILLHDGGGDRTQTVEALRWLLEALPAAGWVPVLPPEQKLSKLAAARTR